MWGNDLGAMSGAVFPYAVPQGQHGFALPGEMTDWALAICRETNGSNAPECSPEAIVGEVYDVGWFMFHTFGKFLRNLDEAPWAIGCFDKDPCNAIPAVPAVRASADLP